MKYPDVIQFCILQRAGLRPCLWRIEYENEGYLYIRKTARKVIRRIVDKNAMTVEGGKHGKD